MIIDTLKNAELYMPLNPDFKKAFDFLEACTKEFPSVGRHIIDDDRIFASVQEYETAPEESNLWEAHRKYIDIQFIQSGHEMIGYSYIDHVKDFTAYNDEKDCLLATKADHAVFIDMLPDCFTILYPNDVHKPKCIAGQKMRIRKIVIKVMIND